MLASHTSRSPRRLSRGRDRNAHRPRSETGVLGRYLDGHGRLREVLARPGHAGSLLVLDRDAHTLADRRLVAHLGADEPPENAALICHLYLHDPNGRGCRALTAADLRSPGPGAPADDDDVPGAAQGSGNGGRADAVGHSPAVAHPGAVAHSAAVAHPAAVGHPAAVAHPAAACFSRGEESNPPPQISPPIVDREGRAYLLGYTSGRLAIPELRWLRSPDDCAVSIREVVGALENYEPVRAHTRAALTRHGGDARLSVAVLRAELRRLDASRIVLNRGLREAVLEANRARGLSMSEIAFRCGRVKYDARGNPSGETSWLARRVGLSPEGGERRPTPWVHSDVLALIARAGLDLSPREVELG